MSVSIVSPMTTVWSVVSPSSLRAARSMTGLGLPTLKALTPVAVSSIATIAPQPGRMPVWVGQLGSRLVATSLAPPRIMPQGRLDHLEVEGAPLADDDVVGVAVDDRVAVAVQGRRAGPPRR